MRWLLASLAVAASCLAAGCGPVQTTRTLSRADREISAARAERADEASPYEFESALLYLDQSRAREGRGDFEAALAYARKAVQFAVEARVRADENRLLEAGRERLRKTLETQVPRNTPAPGDKGEPR